MRAWFERKSESATWRPRYRAQVDATRRRYIEGEGNTRVHLTPTVMTVIGELGHKPVASINRSDLLRVADGIRRGAADIPFVIHLHADAVAVHKR